MAILLFSEAQREICIFAHSSSLQTYLKVPHSQVPTSKPLLPLPQNKLWGKQILGSEPSVQGRLCIYCKTAIDNKQNVLSLLLWQAGQGVMCFLLAFWPQDTCVPVCTIALLGEQE